MTKEKETRDAAIYVRLTQAELDRLDAMTERLPFLSRSGLARVAMVAGLDAIDRQGLETVAAMVSGKGKRGRVKK